jgi:meso-butanediol dehydrogenase/(S,S)-butanediol dehydrogenase/diacetyl reductase
MKLHLRKEKNIMKLEGKTALVTGGNRGIGRGIALSLSKEGANVVVVARDITKSQEVVEEIKKQGSKAIAIKADITKWDQVQAMVKQTLDEFGQIDISVHNAGVVSAAPVDELEEETFDHVMDVNIKGTFFCCKAVIPYMKQQGCGKIINVSSVAGKTGIPNLAHYCASKFAVIGFTNALAKELAKDNITVNTICPGIVRTDMWDYLADTWKQADESVEDSWKRHVETMIPQGRAQTSEDMGNLAVYFAMADNVTGQAFNVDGGFL